MDVNRRSVRLPQFLYRGAAYFITICAFEQHCVFGRIEGEQTILSPLGRIVDDEWTRTALVRPEIRLDEWIVMPNHVHGILHVPEAEGYRLSDVSQTTAPTSSAIAAAIAFNLCSVSTNVIDTAQPRIASVIVFAVRPPRNGSDAQPAR